MFVFLAGTLLLACNPVNKQSRTISSTQQLEKNSNSTGIVGGDVVAATDAIAHSTVQLMDIETSGRCTGSLIGENLVITAAHCTQIDPRNIIVIFATQVPRNFDELRQMKLRRVIGGKTSELWPKVTKDTLHNWGDIAILKFEGDLPEGYTPIKLLQKQEALQTGMKLTLAGFGLTDNIQKIRSTGLRKTTTILAHASYSETEFLMDQRQGTGACHGDSGGPALVNIQGTDYLAGITSHGTDDPKDTCLQFSVFTNVTAHLSWIQKTVAELLAIDFKGKPMPQPNIKQASPI